MSEPHTDQNQLLDEAIDLVIRLQNDPDNAVSGDMIRAWRARSPLHEKIWLRIDKAHGASGAILSHQRREERRKNIGLSRRQFMIGGSALLAAGGLSYSFGKELLLRAQADYITAKGEMAHITLPDGSLVTLGPDSALQLAYGSDRRDINLLRGMGFFEVAPDKSKPFSVLSDTVRVMALGTAFDVSNDAGVIAVSVDHGIVEMQSSDAVLAAGKRLEQGQWISFDPSTQTLDQGAREVEQIAAWRDKLIIAERETVSALVARIGRWMPGRIIMASPNTGAQRVSGVYDLTDPLRALEAVVHPTGAQVRQLSSLVTIITPL
ncbi:FecR domain-containing protein [Bacillus subtilis]|uniref:FecR family protein n=1 Tax=Pseudochrobactrum asaccharolyticum TaxID=354351 RepID=UPI001F1ED58B|nr:FecR domain-containing protein [Pseudochrobactrum asaccharolyticum]MCF7646612.1 FecR domain-containing protein [Pseudochrobactrum asaccharolyticum]MCF7672751.1 FecR domain-containing protein [Bacillus subtilis]